MAGKKGFCARSGNKKRGCLRSPFRAVVESYLPVPVKGTVCGLFGALSVMVTLPVRTPVAVGVKVTLIWQNLPAARLAPQGLALVARAKSPEMAMLLMVSVPVPLLVSFTVLAGLVVPTANLPNFSEVGVKVTAPPPPLAVTVRLTVVVAVKLPDVPSMVTVTVPVAAVALADKVSTLVVLAGFGLKDAVTPLGSPEAANVTAPLNPP